MSLSSCQLFLLAALSQGRLLPDQDALVAIADFVAANPSEVVVCRVEPDKLQLHVQYELRKMEAPAALPGSHRW